MRTFLMLTGTAVILSGCMTQPLTPEQRATMMHIYDQQQANYRAQTENIRAWGQPRNSSTNCISNVVGTTVYTNCH